MIALEVQAPVIILLTISLKFYPTPDNYRYRPQLSIPTQVVKALTRVMNDEQIVRNRIESKIVVWHNTTHLT